MVRVALLLFQHILDADVLDKLPGILGLMRELMGQETGLRCLEVVLRYSDKSKAPHRTSSLK